MSAKFGIVGQAPNKAQINLPPCLTAVFSPVDSAEIFHVISKAQKADYFVSECAAGQDPRPYVVHVASFGPCDSAVVGQINLIFLMAHCGIANPDKPSVEVRRVARLRRRPLAAVQGTCRKCRLRCGQIGWRLRGIRSAGRQHK
ncbi:hypothetical protein SDC9_60139 [bioreactor metagenome]|uniref:Uncharacterized protein n=1 Tax=bioreactor metagenome TaxID=1076179 RepID=A0A644XC38_9ZZZZ